MTTLKVLTLNVWALHWQSIQIRERLGYIVEELKSYDIVGLQEVWREEDYAFLVERLKSTLPHSHRFRSGAVGSGLCVFSRYPIAAAYTHQFSVTGGMHKLFDGEILAGKAITGYKIQTPGGQIAFFNTHTNPRCREIQLFECLQFVECMRGSDVVILMGDFNTKPRHLAYSLLTKCLGLHDVFEKDPVDTCDLVSNIYTKKWMTPKRIDYIFYSDEFAADHSLILKDRRLALSGTIPGEDFPYSDHEGVEATFLLEERDTAISVPQRIYDDTAVQVFLEIADCIHDKKMGYETTESRILRTWTFLFIFSLLVSLFFGSYSVFNFLASYYLHWLCTIITCLVGAGSIVWVVTTLSGAQILNGMEASLAEIRVLLKYNSLLRGTGNGDYKNSTGVTN